MTFPSRPSAFAPQISQSRTRTLLRLIRWMIGEALLQAAVLIVLAWLLPGFIIGGTASVVLCAVGFVLVQAAAWPFIYQLSARLHPLLFPIISLALNAFLLVLFTDLIRELQLGHIHVSSPWVAALVVVALTIGSTLLGALFSLRDDDAYDWFVTRPIRREYGDTEASDVPGILFLEIDGLAEPILRQAHGRRLDADCRPLGIERIAHDHRLGAGPLLPDLCQPGRHPPRRQHRYPRLPLVRQG